MAEFKGAADHARSGVTTQRHALLAQLRSSDLGSLHRLLSIRQIMTPRAAFLCGACAEPVERVLTRVPEVHDEIPILEGLDPRDPDAEVVGVLRRRPASRLPLRRLRERAEDHMDETPCHRPLPPDQAIISYARIADLDRLALVGSPGRIEGLVSIYDLERLLVWAALFVHLIGFEEKMGNFINERQPDAGSWVKMVPLRFEDAVQAGVRRAKSGKHIGAAILALGFTEKLHILAGLLGNDPASKAQGIDVDGLATFRNKVAHDAPFAELGSIPGHLSAMDAIIARLEYVVRPGSAHRMRAG